MLTLEIGPDLRLELVRPEHADPIFEIVDQNREFLRRWLPWIDENRSSDDILEFIYAAEEQFSEGEGFQTIVVHDGRIVGMVGCHRIDWTDRSTALGYWLAESAEGKGLVTRSCRAALDHLFVELGLTRVEIRAAVQNHRSRAVPERLGFRFERVILGAEWLHDRWVDHVVYEIRRDEWEKITRDQR